MTTTKPTTQRADVDRTREALLKLGLDHAAERLNELMGVAVKENYPPHRMLDELLGIESDRREERRVKTSLVLSGLPPGQTIDNFDWSFQPAIDRKPSARRTSHAGSASAPSSKGSPSASTASRTSCTR
jgi:DNA replication protein DnaC